MTILLSIFGFVFIYAAIDVAKNKPVKFWDIAFNKFLVWLLVTSGAICFFIRGYISQSH
jgi:hypothetical protein